MIGKNWNAWYQGVISENLQNNSERVAIPSQKPRFDSDQKLNSWQWIAWGRIISTAVWESVSKTFSTNTKKTKGLKYTK